MSSGRHSMQTPGRVTPDRRPRGRSPAAFTSSGRPRGSLCRRLILPRRRCCTATPFPGTPTCRATAWPQAWMLTATCALAGAQVLVLRGHRKTPVPSKPGSNPHPSTAQTRSSSVYRVRRETKWGTSSTPPCPKSLPQLSQMKSKKTLQICANN